MKQNKKNIHSAFTLAEVLITMIIISLLALATTWAVPKKVRVKKRLLYEHGTYACTIGADGKYYAYESDIIEPPPAINDARWEPVGSCLEKFSVPVSEIMNIRLIGGGGGGGSAAFTVPEVNLNKSFDAREQEEMTVEVPEDGFYDIDVVGSVAERNRLNSWNSNGRACSPADAGFHAASGLPQRVNSSFRLNRNDRIIFQRFQDENQGNVNREVESSCNGDDHPTMFPMQKNYNLRVKLNRNGSEVDLFSVESSNYGNFSCDQAATGNQCSSYRTVSGASGNVEVNNDLDSIFGEGNYTVGASPIVDSQDPIPQQAYAQIKWSDNNGALQNRTYTGCGGLAGEILATSFPLMVNFRIPDQVEVGMGGAAGQAGGTTSFGDLFAIGGKAGYLTDMTRNDVGTTVGICPTQNKESNGGVGEANRLFAHSTGGFGGTNTSINGGSGSGFGAGGGGGGVAGADQLGQGGRGSNGMIWITW